MAANHIADSSFVIAYLNERDSRCIVSLSDPYYIHAMKTLSVRVSDRMAAELAAESRARKVSKSDIVRESLHNRKQPNQEVPKGYQDIADLIGSVDGLPADLSANHKRYLRAGYGRKRSR